MPRSAFARKRCLAGDLAAGQRNGRTAGITGWGGSGVRSVPLWHAATATALLGNIRLC